MSLAKHTQESNEVTALNGCAVWGGDSQLMLGDKEIAKRIGYTRISFIEREQFLAAVNAYRAGRPLESSAPKEPTP